MSNISPPADESQILVHVYELLHIAISHHTKTLKAQKLVRNIVVKWADAKSQSRKNTLGFRALKVAKIAKETSKSASLTVNEITAYLQSFDKNSEIQEEIRELQEKANICANATAYTAQIVQELVWQIKMHMR